MSPFLPYFAFYFFICKAIYSKYLNKFKLHNLYMYFYICVWINLYNKLAEGPGVARCSWKKIGNFFFLNKKILKKQFRILAYNTPRHPWVSTKNFSPIGPAVWPAIRNIYTNVSFYYIDNNYFLFLVFYFFNIH